MRQTIKEVDISINKLTAGLGYFEEKIPISTFGRIMSADLETTVFEDILPIF